MDADLDSAGNTTKTASQTAAPAKNRVAAVIPARLASTRLDKKVLRPIAGMPMVGWVYRAALACPELDRVLIATDSEEVAAYANSEGWTAVMTSADLPSGTDRVHAVSQLVDAEIYVNIQGDEPLLRPEHISALLRPFSRAAGDRIEVTTVGTDCPPHDIANPNAVKVVTAPDGRALYFSRAAIPHHRDGGAGAMKHLGLYGYRRRALNRFAALPPSRLELIERLEQLRLLEDGIDIYVEECPFDTIGVDAEADLAAAERVLRQRLANS